MQPFIELELNRYCSNFLSCLLVAYNKKIIIRNKIQVTRRKETLYNILCWLPSTLLINKVSNTTNYHFGASWDFSRVNTKSTGKKKAIFSQRAMAVRAYQSCMQVYLFFSINYRLWCPSDDKNWQLNTRLQNTCCQINNFHSFAILFW